MGALELHIWGSHNDTLEKPDRIVFDLDPDEDMDFSAVRARRAHARPALGAGARDLSRWSTGGKGIHVVAPLTPRYGWEDVKTFAEALARTIAAEEPKRYLAVATKAKRTGRIFIDYLRNGRGATAICPFSTAGPQGRAGRLAGVVGGAVAAEGRPAGDGGDRRRAAQGAEKDPWAGYFDVDQVLPLEQLNVAGMPCIRLIECERKRVDTAVAETHVNIKRTNASCG